MRSKTLLMVSGTGISISFGLPTTLALTNCIESRLITNLNAFPSSIGLYKKLKKNLKKYLTRPGIVTFEDIYQSIQDLRVIHEIPDAQAFDEFRPRVGATHILKRSFKSYTKMDSLILQNAYLDSLLDTFLYETKQLKNLIFLKNALGHLSKKFKLWSYTLNYDVNIDDYLVNYENGFQSGPGPKPFLHEKLLAAPATNKNINVHLHGSLKWGFLLILILLNFMSLIISMKA